MKEQYRIFYAHFLPTEVYWISCNSESHVTYGSCSRGDPRESLFFWRTRPSGHIWGYYRQLALIGSVDVSGERLIQLTVSQAETHLPISDWERKHCRLPQRRDPPHSPAAYRHRTRGNHRLGLHLYMTTTLWPVKKQNGPNLTWFALWVLFWSWNERLDSLQPWRQGF